MHRLDNDRNKSINLPIGLPIIIGLFGIVPIIVGISDFLNARQSMTWPSTKGKIINSYVSQGAKSSHAYIRYEYTVENITYSGDRLTYSTLYERDYGHSYLLQSRFYKGAAIDVYFEPNSPNKSVLICGYKQELNEFSAIITGSYILSIAILVGWTTRKRKAGSG